MDQKFIFAGTSGYGDSYLHFQFRLFKVFKLHAILHDAAGAVGARSGKGLGYCYMIGRGPNSCLLGHVTGQNFCLDLKAFRSSTLNSVDLWSSITCILLDIEPADINDFKELGVRLTGNSVLSLRPPMKYKLTKQAFWCTRNVHGIVWNSRCFYYFELPNILPRDVNGKYFAKGTENCNILGNSLDKKLENLDDHGCFKNRDLADEEFWIWSSYPFGHKTTLECAERKAKLLGHWEVQILKLWAFCTVQCFFSIRVIKSLKWINFFPIFSIEKLSVQVRWLIRKKRLI